MKIYRSILLNQEEKIDNENIGCSWTFDEPFAENHAKDINNYQGKDGFVVISAEIQDDMIDWDNTLYSMENRPKEFEVVLNPGHIDYEIEYVWGIDYEESGSGEIGNNNFEDYCEEYEGEITKEDFFKIVNEIA